MEEGVIVEQGPPEQVLDAPRDERTKQFLRRFLETGAVPGHDDHPKHAHGAAGHRHGPESDQSPAGA
jgi:ABC-type glutathione transport system ATPase component